MSMIMQSLQDPALAAIYDLLTQHFTPRARSRSLEVVDEDGYAMEDDNSDPPPVSEDDDLLAEEDQTPDRLDERLAWSMGGDAMLRRTPSLSSIWALSPVDPAKDDGETLESIDQKLALLECLSLKCFFKFYVLGVV